MRTLMLAGTLIALMGVKDVKAGFINFDDGAIGSSIGSFYSGMGVEFTNASWDTSLNLPGTSGAISIRASTNGGFSNRYRYLQSHSLIARFAPGVTDVSISALDVGDNGVRIEAFDQLNGGSLVDSKELTLPGFGVGNINTLSVSGTSIRRIEIFQLRDVSNDGVLLDNLSFSSGGGGVVPEPASAMVWCGLLLGLTRLRKRS